MIHVRVTQFSLNGMIEPPSGSGTTPVLELSRELRHRLEDVIRIELDRWEAHKALHTPLAFICTVEVKA
jgi:hypothetical protein